MRPTPARRQATVRFRGRRFTIAEANALAIREFGLRNFPVALELYELIAAKLPDNAEIHNNRGAVLQQLKRYPEALASYNQALGLKPDYANVLHNRGTTLNRLKRYEEAVANFDRAIALKPDHLEAYHNRGVALQELTRYDEALASYDKVLDLDPYHAEACNNRGLILTNKGNLAEAEKMFLKASVAKPDFVEPLFNLTTTRRYDNADHADVKHICAVLEKPETSTEDRECLYFCLGKIYDDCGRYDEAFEFYRQANEIRNAAAGYHPEKIERLATGLMEVFINELLPQPAARTSGTRMPVFIVGMPRSGTTLLAGILSNHCSIASAGELSTMTDLAGHLREITGCGVPYPHAARHVSADVAARLTDEYLASLRRGMATEAAYIIDKNPLNFANLGLIALLFPGTHIIHCTRNPLDTGLSTYFQRFPLNLDYAFDLRNIGHFYGQYARLMEHWKKLPAINLLEVSYENMVNRTESTAREALDFLGLEWDSRCLVPHTNPGIVETASRWQVRQPIYQHSIDRWRHYEKHLTPLKEALLAAGVAV